MGTYMNGGIGELTELIYASGHTIHIAAIDTRCRVRCLAKQ